MDSDSEVWHKTRVLLTLMRRSVVACLVCCSLVVSACSKEQKQLKEMGLSEQEARRILAEISAKKARSAAPKAVQSAPPKPQLTTEQEAPPSAPIDVRLTNDRWIVDSLVDLAPAAPAAAHSEGVFLVDGQNRLWLAKLGRLSRSSKAGPSPITPIPDEAGRFPLGRGPSLTKDHAYWVTSHFLLRRAIKPPYGELEVLAEDARVGTRTSALDVGAGKQSRPWVAYIALPSVKDGPLKAKLWYGTESHLLLTPEASSALSVQLVQHEGRVWSISLEARTGMTTLHAREIFLSDPPRLGPDEIAWVAGSSHPLTELHTAVNAQGIWGLLPMEQDITHFGLAVLQFDLSHQAEPRHVRWSIYANGLDPAPVATARLCGHLAILLVRPSTAEQGSPQELVLAQMHDGLPDTGLVLSRSKAFYDVSITNLKNKGALLSFVADHRTWARTVRCSH